MFTRILLRLSVLLNLVFIGSGIALISYVCGAEAEADKNKTPIGDALHDGLRGIHEAARQS